LHECSSPLVDEDVRLRSLSHSHRAPTVGARGGGVTLAVASVLLVVSVAARVPAILGGMRILFVCMGNICRSPTAEGVMQIGRAHV
jgi:hypothetical protein